MNESRPNAFSTYHPAVAFCYIACALLISMATMHPVFSIISLVGAFVSSTCIRGLRASVRSLIWAIPLMLIITIANPLFSASGSTELLRIGSTAIYLESLIYGLCSGCMLSSVFLWFSCYSACMNSANTTLLFGNILPVVSLMVSQVLRLVPQFVSRGRDIAAAQDSVSAAMPRTKREKADGRLRIVSVLMSWGMEDGIERSDAMRARGYDCGAKRTTYKRYHFAKADGVVLGAIALLAVVSAACAIAICMKFTFYPTMSSLEPWWGYLPYVAYLAIAPALQFKEWLIWRS